MSSHTFGSLPPDVLGQILTGVNALQLWKCGNPAVNAKIALGVDHISLSAIPGIDCKVPPLLSNFRSLRYLSIQSGSTLQKDKIDWTETVKSLPQSLEHIRVVARDSAHAFLNYDAGDILGNDYGTPKPLETIYQRGSSRFVDIGALFPRLHSLELGKNNIDLNDLVALPNTLTYLQANASASNIPSVCPLPSSLRKIEGNIDHRPTLEYWSPLSQLESCDQLNWSKFKTAEWLPRSLTHLTYQSGSASNCVWTRELAESFPQGLHSLSLSDVEEYTFSQPSKWMSELPRAISSFHFEHWDFADMSLQFALPSTITLLNIQLYQRAALDVKKVFLLDASASIETIRSQWPPSLTVLRLPQTSILNSDFEFLPHSLLELEVGIAPIDEEDSKRNPDIDASKLPPNLTKLFIGDSFDGGKLTIHGKLSSTLQTLHFQTERCTAKLTSESIAALPNSIQDLFIIGPARAIDLPKFIARLELQVLDGDDLIKLPRTLTNLQIRFMDKFEDLLNAGSFFETLPASMKRLKLSQRDDDNDTVYRSQRLLNTLPSLESLSIQKFAIMESSFIRELPRGLKVAHLALDCFSVVDAEFFPPGLVELSNNGPIAPQVANHWPLGAIGGLDQQSFRIVETRVRKLFH